MLVSDIVNHLKHYKECSLECIDIMSVIFGNDNLAVYCMMNAYKYMHRYKNKNGLQGLKKAEWYLNKVKEIEQSENPAIEHFEELEELLEKCMNEVGRDEEKADE